MSFSITKGDREPDMEITVKANGAALDISDSLSHSLLWYKPDGTSATVVLTAVDLASGRLKRVWASGDTDLTGTHRGKVVVVRTNGEEQTFPSNDVFLRWRVTPRIL